MPNKAISIMMTPPSRASWWKQPWAMRCAGCAKSWWRWVLQILGVVMI